MAWSLGFWHWNLAIAIFRSTPRDHILHGCRWLGHQQPQKKQVYALAGFLVLCDLRSTELWIPSKEASITDRLFYQSQWCFLELKQLSSEQIMEPSKPRISSHRNQNWTEDYEQGWTGSGRLIIWIVSRIITILVWMEQEQALLHRKQSGMIWVLMCLGVCKWKLIMKSSYHS